MKVLKKIFLFFKKIFRRNKEKKDDDGTNYPLW